MGLQVAVFGLGRFGMALATEVERKGYGVLAVDIDPEKVNQIEGLVSSAIRLHTINEQELRDSGVTQCDVAVIGFAKNIESNILLTQMLKDLGVGFIIARAESAVHARVLQKIGADDIFFPEQDMAVRIANRITGTSFLDFIEISDEYAIYEFPAPNYMVGKKILDLDLRKEKQTTIIAIRRGDEVLIPPDPMQILDSEDLLIAIGPRKTLQEISKNR